AGAGAQERRPPRRARPVRLRLRRVPLPGAGAALLAAIRGALPAAPGRLPGGAAAEGAAGLAPVRLRQGPGRPTAALGLGLRGAAGSASRLAPSAEDLS